MDRAHQRAIDRDVVGPCWQLFDAGRFDEAEALLGNGLARYPDDPDLLIASARLGILRQRKIVPEERWRAVLRDSTDRPDYYVGLCGAFRLILDTPRALELVQEALERFPAERTVLVEAARIAQARADFEGALSHWQQACGTEPCDPDWLLGQADTLMMLGRLEEAGALVEDLASRHADDDETIVRRIQAARGKLIGARKDWAAAITFWKDFQSRYPDSAAGWRYLGLAVENLAFLHVDKASALAGVAVADEGPAQIDVVSDDSVEKLLMGFESIGNGCEFGLLQRRYGAEPIGLLRWNSVPIDQLIAALAENMDGFGTPENTVLDVLPNGEFLVSDRRWGLHMHTWLFVGQIDRDVLYQKMCRRVAFLKDKFLADLEAAEKIFVFHAQALDADKLDVLHRSMRRFGPVKLLGVQPAYTDGQTRDVMQIGEDRFVGFIGRLGRRDYGVWDIAFDDWVAVCETTAAMAARRARPPTRDAMEES